jgi:hypothetical protein
MKNYTELTINEKINQKQSEVNRIIAMGQQTICYNPIFRLFIERAEPLYSNLFAYPRSIKYFRTGGLIN